MDAELQPLIRQRAKHRCEYCQFPEDLALLPFQFDHIIPQKLSGPTEAANLAWSCERCNSHKGALVAGYLNDKHIPLFNPRKDQWHDHFAWDGALLAGKTEIGEATIQVLAINLPYRVALRAALIYEGVFPPRDQ